jgi:hypothetical protein
MRKYAKKNSMREKIAVPMRKIDPLEVGLAKFAHLGLNAPKNFR